MKTSRTYVLLELLSVFIENDVLKAFEIVTFLFSDNSAVDPPEPIPNSEVKCSSADGSVGVPM